MEWVFYYLRIFIGFGNPNVIFLRAKSSLTIKIQNVTYLHSIYIQNGSAVMALSSNKHAHNTNLHPYCDNGSESFICFAELK